MHRDSQNFPAAGLRWQVAFANGPNRLRAVAARGQDTVTDEIELTCQTEAWDEPAELKLSHTQQADNTITVEAKLFDANGILCLDSSKSVRFSLAGAGHLIDNLGTTRASREVQLSNGRAQISLVHRGRCRVIAQPEGLPAASLDL
jgi:beta-galactosidase